MKQDLHPTWYPEAVVICQCGNTWTTGATTQEIRTEICSNCHPFYTGEQRIVDTEGRVDKFMDRLRQRDKMRADAEERKTAQTPMDLPVKDLGLNTRYVNILAENDITEVQHLIDYMDGNPDKLLDITGIGRQALSDTKKALRSRGYEFEAQEEAEAESDS